MDKNMLEFPEKCPKCGCKIFCIPDNAMLFGIITECVQCKYDWLDEKYHTNEKEILIMERNNDVYDTQ